MGRNRERSRAKMCPRCKVTSSLCFCEEIKKVITETHISFVMFKDERHLTSNTVNLAALCLEKLSIDIRGLQDQPLSSTFIFKDGYTPLYLYPTEDAKVLTPDFVKTLNGPVQLIIPDGTWRQASKVHKREEIFKDVQKVVISPKHESLYRLRQQSDPSHLCSFEAMAEALAVLEKNGEIIYEQLISQFIIMNNRFSQARGLPFK